VTANTERTPKEKTDRDPQLVSGYNGVTLVDGAPLVVVKLPSSKREIGNWGGALGKRKLSEGKLQQEAHKISFPKREGCGVKKVRKLGFPHVTTEEQPSRS